MKTYLVVKLKNGECKKYSWGFVDFTLVNENIPLFIVYEAESGELLLVAPIENVEYYERCTEGV